MKAPIVIEIEDFLCRYEVTQLSLAREAGVSRVLLNRLVKGSRRDTTSSNADALRAAMRRLSSPNTPTEPEEVNHGLA